MWSILNRLVSQWGESLKPMAPNGGSHVGGAMASIVPFISNAGFEPADIKVMSDAYNKGNG